jgi:hypothetical protein
MAGRKVGESGEKIFLYKVQTNTDDHGGLFLFAPGYGNCVVDNRQIFDKKFYA